MTKAIIFDFDGVLLESEWAGRHDLTTGDTLEVTEPTGTKKWRVVGLFEDNPLVFGPVLTTIPMI